MDSKWFPDSSGKNRARTDWGPIAWPPRPCVCLLPGRQSLPREGSSDHSVTECRLDLFQSSLKRRGSRETYKEKKTFNQVSRSFFLMLLLLKRPSSHFEFSLKMLMLPFKYSKKHYLQKNLNSFKTSTGETFLSKHLLCLFLAPISWWFLQEREQTGFVWDTVGCSSGLWQYPYW